MNKHLAQKLFEKKYQGKCSHLCKDSIITFIVDTLELLFPQMGQRSFPCAEDLEVALSELENKLRFIFSCLHKELDDPETRHAEVISKFFDEIPSLVDMLDNDAKFMAAEDPASESLDEVYICYPGFFAIAVYRIAHFFYKQGVPVFPRVLAEYAHQKTGVDIHPGAQIGCPFFIDHGTGVVIGETTVIGDACKIFQGVTLGALSAKKKYKNQKRHPTIGNNCLIYSSAVILGGKTVIGDNSIIGGNVWITESIPENSQVFRKHGFEIQKRKES